MMSEGNDHGNNVQGKPWVTILKWARLYSTEISLLLKFGSSLQEISYSTGHRQHQAFASAANVFASHVQTRAWSLVT